MTKSKLAVTPLPDRVLLDLSSDCNLRCPMCVVHGNTDDPRVNSIIKKNMKISDAKKILNEIEGSTQIIGPGLWSEPLMGKDILMNLENIKLRGLKISLNTNALLLNKEIASKLIEIGVDSITISIDATTNDTLKLIRGIRKLEKIEKHITQFLELRGEKSIPRLGVSFTKQPENIHEEQDFIKKWTEVVDFVRVGEIFENGKFPNIKVDQKKRIPCPELYNTMAIHTNGDVSICCLDGFKDVIVGNAVKEGVENVWNGEKLNEIRNHHELGQWDKIPFCKNCDRWASSSYEDTIEGSLLIRRSAEYTFYNRIDRLKSWNNK
ncbi:radical SAM/SPASM domain-containing protein [Marinomonas sp. 2405UD68-3]|uniref:radical SAM/SPASM domain-containing protein n=1 Tax=Marinomonas sp. 2405UD68-3 TaxID=3391835 RepID=UPI0039C9B0A1